MRKQYLWIDRRGADLRWSALGNVSLGPTGKGTLAMWVRQPITQVPWVDDKLFTIACDSNNHLTTRLGHGLMVRSGGSEYPNPLPTVDRTRSGTWELLVYQWDFSQGLLQSFYNDARPGMPAVTGVPAPVGSAQYLQLGPKYSTPTAWGQDNLMIHGVAIWDDLLTTPQIVALYQKGYLDEFQETDGAGNLTLLLRLNESLLADVAGGDGTCTVGATTPADRYCFLSEGARSLGVMSYPLGRPRHDGTADDRKPLNAVLPLTWDFDEQRAALTDTNLTNYSVLRVQNYSQTAGAGAYCKSIPQPGTWRQLVHVPNENNVPGTELGLGPIMYKHYPSASTGVYDQYGSGRSFTVVADPANTATAFKTDLDARFGEDYWKGAWVTFYSGNCRGRTLVVAGYNAATKVLTLETALPATPSEGSVGMVSPYSRLIGRSTTLSAPDYRYAMEANLWANHLGTEKAFIELEWANSGAPQVLRYHRGRTAPMPGVASYGGTYGVLYGKPYGAPASPVNLEVWLRKVELGGPQRYQILRREAGRPGPAQADNFMVLTRDYLGAGGDSVKVWRKLGVGLNVQPPAKYPDFEQVTADLGAVGTWREQAAGPPVPVAYDEAREEVTCALLGRDAAGKLRLGYVVGHWDEGLGRPQWVDETPPAGKQNPFLEWATLRADAERDGPNFDGGYLVNILQSIDGTWSLFYEAGPDNVDDLQTYALHGAADRWSFDFATQYAGVVVPMVKGVDGRDPVTGNGYTPWANQHLPWSVMENPDSSRVERRYLAFSGGKTIYNNGPSYSADARPVMGAAGADVKALAPLPYGNTLTPLVARVVHTFVATPLGQEDCLGLMFQDGNTSGIGLLTSEDGVHFQLLFNNWPQPPMLVAPRELPGESNYLEPGSCLRLGERRLYYYCFDYRSHFNFASTRWNGETSYALNAGETEGWLETAILERPAGGWAELYLNLTLGGGTAQVELRDPETEQPLPGYTRADCDALAGGIKQRVSWSGEGLGQVTEPYVRLRVYLTRGMAELESPRVYAWETGPGVIVTPQVGALQVEGEAAPAGVGVAHPRFSWTYEHAAGKAQAAYQVQVASTEERLEAGLPDMWDTGVRLGNATSVIYGGQALEDNEMYFWRVRVRDTEGVWSEAW